MHSELACDQGAVEVAPQWRQFFLTHIFMPLVIVTVVIIGSAFHIPVTRSCFQFVELLSVQDSAT
jgi:hypothetical protein